MASKIATACRKVIALHHIDSVHIRRMKNMTQLIYLPVSHT